MSSMRAASVLITSACGRDIFILVISLCRIKTENTPSGKTNHQMDDQYIYASEDTSNQQIILLCVENVNN
jgi:hypothetical protein